MTKTILILGITGKQGGSVARLFLTLPNWHVRGLTRNPSSPSALAWAAQGVEVLAGNLDDASSLTVAFAGASVVFSTTDFWGPFYNPSTLTVLKEGQTLGEYCYEKELQQGKNIFDVASQVPGLERIVVSSMVDASTLSKGKYTGVYHWDGKAGAVTYLRGKYPQLAGKMSVLLVGNYMENWMEDLKLQKMEDESYRLGLVGGGVNLLPHINVEKDVGYIVKAVIESAPGKIILGAGEMISWTEMLRVWCEHSKVLFGGFDALSLEMFERLIPFPGLGRELGEMMAFMDEFGYVGGEKVVLPSELDVPCPMTSWEDYVKEQDWSEVLSK